MFSSRHNPSAPQHRGIPSGGTKVIVIARSPKNGGQGNGETNQEVIARLKDFQAIKALKTKADNANTHILDHELALASLETNLVLLQDMLDKEVDQAILDTVIKNYEMEEHTTLTQAITILQFQRDIIKKDLAKFRRRRTISQKAHSMKTTTFGMKYGKRMYAKMAA